MAESQAAGSGGMPILLHSGGMPRSLTSTARAKKDDADDDDDGEDPLTKLVLKVTRQAFDDNGDKLEATGDDYAATGDDYAATEDDYAAALAVMLVPMY